MNLALSLLAVAIAAVLYGPGFVRWLGRLQRDARLHQLNGHSPARAFWLAIRW